MERTLGPRKSLTPEQIRVFSEITNRAMLASKLGFQYGTSRDVYEALGYKTTLEFSDYFTRYTRQDIAKAIIDRPVKATWSGPLELIESDEAEDTEFEEAWEELDRTLGLKTMLSRVDRLTGIGHYGVLLLGLNDVSNHEGFIRPVSKGATELKYVKPFGESSAKIDEYVTDPKDSRYGKPLIYSMEVADLASDATKTVKVHYSRVIHITDDNLESDVLGTPRLEAVFNRLMDLEKLVGGDAEMFWRGARPGFHGKVDPEFTMTTALKEDLLNQLDEYEHNLRRFLTTEGVDIKDLAQQIADPANHVDVQLQMISAVTGIPKRVLTGSERGELASSQDTTEWLSYVQARREDHAEPRIVRPFVDRLIELTILPEPGEDYTVKWQDLFSISEKARVEIGKGRANALREYTYTPMSMEVLPPDLFLEICLGLTKEQITLAQAMRDKQMGDESDELMGIVKDMLDKEAAPDPVPVVAGPGAKPVAKKPVTRTNPAK